MFNQRFPKISPSEGVPNVASLDLKFIEHSGVALSFKSQIYEKCVINQNYENDVVVNEQVTSLAPSRCIGKLNCTCLYTYMYGSVFMY